ncbi:MAG: RNA polymerase factor sigma-54 [Alphaproteobacteria bacterium]
MATGIRLEQRLGQSLVMTPQLQQAIKLLQLSNIELQAYVEQELEKNPLLELAPPEEGVPQEATADTPFEPDESGDRDEPVSTPDSAELTQSDTLASEASGPLDASYENVYDGDVPAVASAPAQLGEAGPVAYGAGGRSDFEDSDSLEGTLTRPKSLREHVEEQIALDATAPIDRHICTYLMDQIDDSGYFTGDTAEIATNLGCEIAQVENAWRLLQGCEPVGLFARSLEERFKLQLEDRGRCTLEMELLVDNLALLAARDVAKLTEICEVSEDELVEMKDEIRTLDPKPGLAFDHDIVQTAVPDVFVFLDPGGNWVVTLNTETLPRVLVNNQYYAVVSRKMRSRDEKTYVQESLQTANWLVRALDQRAQTILKVAGELVRQQDMFFEKGVRHLRPLTLRDIAEKVEMHESTISRVTSNKYMATPRGVFELKYFFSAAIPGTNGATVHSASSVRHRIKELIDGESIDDVLSDDRLVSVLASNGVMIKRRTVAKYRESLRIPSSIQRRRQKSARI